MNAKRFFYVAAGILLLVVAYSIGAHRVDAQSGGQFAGIGTWNSVNGEYLVAITTSGDLYARGGGLQCWDGLIHWNDLTPCAPPGFAYIGNVLGGTVGVQGKSLSDVKGTYRGK